MELVLWKRCEDQGQSRFTAVMLENGAVDFPKEALAIPVNFILAARTAALNLHRIAAFAGSAIALGETGLALFRQLTAECFLYGLWNTISQLHFVDTVTVAFEQAHLLLIRVCRSQHGGLVEGFARQLQTEGQTAVDRQRKAVCGQPWERIDVDLPAQAQPAE